MPVGMHGVFSPPCSRHVVTVTMRQQHETRAKTLPRRHCICVLCIIYILYLI